MNKLFYCLDCKRLMKGEEKCDYCGSMAVKELKKDSPVNIIGTKQKGRILKIEENDVSVLLITESKEKVIKNYRYEKLRKII